MKSCPICKTAEARLDRVLNGYDLLKCCHCSFVFADLCKEVIEEANASLDDQYVDNFEENVQSPFEIVFFRQLAARYHAISGPGRVLDVGCGTGLLLSFFKELGWDCVGVDLSSWTGRYAQRYGFTFHHGRLEDLALPEKSFDLIVSTSTLEHIEAPLPHIKEILRIVKPGGQAYFSGIPNYRSAAVRLGVSNFIRNMPPGHPNYFTLKTLRQLFTAAGVSGSDLTVKSYGLPGAHQAYFAMKKILKKLLSMKSSVVTETDTGTRTGAPSCENSTGDRQSLRSLCVALYVVLGRSFGAGSKLEAEISP